MHPSLSPLFKKYRLDAFLIADLANIRKFTGFTGSNALLLITLRQAYFFTDSRYTEQAKKEIRDAVLVLSDRSLSAAILKLIRRHHIRRLGFEAAFITVARLDQLEKILAPTKLIPWTEPEARLRIIKTPAEIRALRTAAAINAHAFQDILPLLQPGITELKIRQALETALLSHGADKPAFDTILASGRRGALPHGKASSKKIKRGELVTIDFGGLYHGYHADETVTVALGPVSQKQKIIYQIVAEAQAKAIALAKPGVACSKLDTAARKYITQKGYGKYFGHALGHGVGLEIHEWPVLSEHSTDVLAPNMVFTIEPGIYIPGWGGVRLEDMFVCTPRGAKRLTQIKKDTLLTIL